MTDHVWKATGSPELKRRATGHFRVRLMKIVMRLITCISGHRALFKWMSKVITRLRLLRPVIGLKIWRQFFNQWEEKQKPISRTLSRLHVIALNSDWHIALSTPLVIGSSNYSGLGFTTVNRKGLYLQLPTQYHSFLIFYFVFNCFFSFSCAMSGIMCLAREKSALCFRSFTRA